MEIDEIEALKIEDIMRDIENENNYNNLCEVCGEDDDSLVDGICHECHYKYDTLGGE